MLNKKSVCDLDVETQVRKNESHNEKETDLDLPSAPPMEEYEDQVVGGIFKKYLKSESEKLPSIGNELKNMGFPEQACSKADNEILSFTNKLTAMGFPQDISLVAAGRYCNNIDAAVNFILLNNESNSTTNFKKNCGNQSSNCSSERYGIHYPSVPSPCSSNVRSCDGCTRKVEVSRILLEGGNYGNEKTRNVGADFFCSKLCLNDFEVRLDKGYKINEGRLSTANWGTKTIDQKRVQQKVSGDLKWRINDDKNDENDKIAKPRNHFDKKLITQILAQDSLRLHKNMFSHCMGNVLFVDKKSNESTPKICNSQFGYFSKKIKCSMCFFRFCQNCAWYTKQKLPPCFKASKTYAICSACTELAANYEDYNIMTLDDMKFLRNNALENDNGQIKLLASSKRALLRKYSKQMNDIVAKGSLFNADLIIKCLVETKGNIEKAELMLQSHELHIVEKKKRELLDKKMKFLQNREQEFQKIEQRKREIKEEEQRKKREFDSKLSDISEIERQNLLRQKSIEANKKIADQERMLASKILSESKKEKEDLKRLADEERKSISKKRVEERVELVKRGNIIWKCEYQPNKWADYGIDIAVLIEYGFDQKETTHFIRSGMSYRIDWANMMQVNVETNVCRKIKRDLFNAKDVETKVEEARKAEKKILQELYQKQQKENIIKAKAESALEFYVWQCHANNKWNDYDRATCLKLEIAFINKFKNVTFDIQYKTSSKKFTYCVETRNDGTMVQINTDTKVERFVKRCKIMEIGWGVQSKCMDKYCTKWECLPSKTGANTLDNWHFNFASKQFEKFIKGKTVTKVEYWENQLLRNKWNKKLKELKNKGYSDRIWVFHGTSPTSLPKIMKGGFKIGGQNGHPVSNGTVHGQGVYTGVGVSGPITFKNGANQLILCEALIGKKDKNDSKGANGGDSWTPRDDWVVFKTSEQLLPTYVVHYN
jgi:hypothetical protein